MGALVHIFGASGSGTSTLGAALAAQCGFRQLDTDDFFWQPTDPPFTVKRPRPERLTLLRQALSEAEKTVLSGALCGWGDELIPLMTLAVRVITPTDVRLRRLRERESRRFGERVRPGGDMHEAHLAFLDWAAAYDTGDLSMRSRAEHDAWSATLCCPLYVADGTRPADETASLLRERFAL